MMMGDKKQLGSQTINYSNVKSGTCFLEAVCDTTPGSRQRMQNLFSVSLKK